MAAITKGNVSPIWRVGVPVIDADGLIVPGQMQDISSDYVCTVACATASPAISRVVATKNSDNTRFLVQLTAAETKTMAAGNHTIAIEITNSVLSPPYVNETRQVLEIVDEIIP